MRTRILFIVLVGAVAFFYTEASAGPVGTAFTYQGQLKEDAKPVDGTADFRCRLYDAAIGGMAIGSTVTVNNVTVNNGLFTIDLDFGAVFDGDERWLDISVASPSGSGFTQLAPRQAIRPGPYAAYALDGAGGGGSLWQQNGSDVYYNAGNVGIGVTSPSNPLYVTGSGSRTIYAQTTNPLGTAIRGQNGSTYVEIASPNAAVFAICASGYGVRAFSADSWGVFGKVPNGSMQAGVVGVIEADNGGSSWTPNSGVSGASEDGWGVAGGWHGQGPPPYNAGAQPGMFAAGLVRVRGRLAFPRTSCPPAGDTVQHAETANTRSGHLIFDACPCHPLGAGT